MKLSVLGRTGRIHGHITLSPSEYLKLFDALEGTLDKEAVQGMEPSKVHGEDFLKKAAVSHYKQTQKTLFLDKYRNNVGILKKLQHSLKEVGTARAVRKMTVSSTRTQTDLLALSSVSTESTVTVCTSSSATT